MKMTIASLFSLLCIGLNATPSYAPVQIHEWNGQQVSRIKVSNPEDFTFAVFGDNKPRIS